MLYHWGMRTNRKLHYVVRIDATDARFASTEINTAFAAAAASNLAAGSQMSVAYVAAVDVSDAIAATHRRARRWNSVQ